MAQRPAGLARGPQVRKERAALCRALRDGTIELAPLIAGAGAEWDEAVALRMTVRDLLAAGAAHPVSVASSAGLTTTELALRDLTTAQRRRLAAAIRKENR